MAYTIGAGDSNAWFASDRMNGMVMKPGSTFHADYMEGWEPKARDTWNCECIDKLLNCSTAQLL